MKPDDHVSRDRHDENRGDCLVCGRKYVAGRLPGLFECPSCGFISANMSLSRDELESLYGRDYFHGSEYLDYVAEEESLKLNFRNRINTLKKIIPDLGNRALFEIGCAYGFFLDEIKGHVKSAKGIDISGDAVEHARTVKRVDAARADYLDYDPDEKFDIITMWDTVEHLYRPDLFIEKAAGDLNPGGFIALTTGDIASANARFRGAKWRMIHPPTHLHYFSVSSMSKLLDRMGFEVVHASHPGNARNLRSVLHFVLALQMKQRALYKAISPWSIFDMSLTVNLFDIMFIVARRK